MFFRGKKKISEIIISPQIVHLAEKKRKETFLQLLIQMKRNFNITQQDNDDGL